MRVAAHGHRRRLVDVGAPCGDDAGQHVARRSANRHSTDLMLPVGRVRAELAHDGEVVLAAEVG